MAILPPLEVMKSTVTSTLFCSAQASTCFFIAAFAGGTQWSQNPTTSLPAAPAVRICTNGRAVAAAAVFNAVRRGSTRVFMVLSPSVAVDCPAVVAYSGGERVYVCFLCPLPRLCPKPRVAQYRGKWPREYWVKARGRREKSDLNPPLPNPLTVKICGQRQPGYHAQTNRRRRERSDAAGLWLPPKGVGWVGF